MSAKVKIPCSFYCCLVDCMSPQRTGKTSDGWEVQAAAVVAGQEFFLRAARATAGRQRRGGAARDRRGVSSEEESVDGDGECGGDGGGDDFGGMNVVMYDELLLCVMSYHATQRDVIQCDMYVVWRDQMLCEGCHVAFFDV